MNKFYKYQGTGNDFIIFDNRDLSIHLSQKEIEKLCNRKFGIGADGLMLLQNKEGFDFDMIYYNADGNESSMCGNGGRCLTKFANDIGIKKDKYLFNATDGVHESYLAENNWINLKMIDVEEVRKHHSDFILNTGSPHFIKNVFEVKKIDVKKEGSEIRYSKEFEHSGININFVEQLSEDQIFVRTYERGVEDETLSCGTGVTASALMYYHNENGFNRIDVETLGGKLAVEFDKAGDNKYNNIWLCGPAEFVFSGEISI